VGEFLSKVSGQISDFIKGLTLAKKMALVGIAATIAGGIGLMFIWAGNTTYVPLMNNLTVEDSSNIMRVLREKNIPFKMEPGGKGISIPPEYVHELRLQLATQGLPQSGVVGYEVFDKQNFGTTSFVQKLNQKRALEGELMRTINSMKGVKRSRVHLAIPQKSTFVEDQKKATASVVLDLEPGTILNDKQVYGVGNLVARAVEGLEVPDVVIMDANGKTLSKNASDSLSAATASQLDFQQRLENDFERRIEGILARVVGEGRVVAKVNADLDFSQTNETQTIYDGDGASIRSVEKRSDSMSGSRPGPQGPAGATANTPGQPQQGSSTIKNDTQRQHETVNYEIPQTIRKTQRPIGTVKRISVAVVVDGKSTKAVNKEGKAETKIEPWAPEKLKEFEDLIAGAVGIDRKRGDTLEIKNMEFTREDFEDAQKIIADNERRSYIQSLVVYGVIGLTIALFFMFVVRPFIKWITENTIDSVDTFLPQTIEELERLQAGASLPNLEEAVPVLPDKIDPQKVEGEMIKEKITTLVDVNPHKAAMILKDWLVLDSPTNAAKKDEAAKTG
jgi:flagellar M-ring protein FliF